MDLAQERLINEVLAWAKAADYRFWPRGKMPADTPPRLATLKSRLRQIWMAGDYDRIARYMESAAEAFYDRLPVPRGSRLLDVGCGAGQLALIASRKGATATGVDIAENLVERARERARVEGLTAQFRWSDAEALPFAGASFDVVTSINGVMFAPRPLTVTRELLRVCRPGGIIAIASWTENGFIGRMFKAISGFVALPGMPAPILWGDEATIRERFRTGVSDLRLTRRNVEFNYPFPPPEVVRFYRAYHGPTNRAFASLDRAGKKNLEAEMEALWSRHNLARGGFTKVDAEWLEVVAVRA